MQVRQWIQAHRQYEKPPAVKTTEYGVAWRLWWRELQPAVRLDAAGELQRPSADVVQGGSWGVLRRGGPNGFFLVLLALGWWVRAAVDKQDVKDAFAMVEDILWVLKDVLNTEEAFQGKEGSDDGQEEGVEGDAEERETVADGKKRRAAKRSPNAKRMKHT